MPTLNELLVASSRTFAIGIEALPEPLRSQVRIAYLLLRVSDYLEDNRDMEPALKSELLRQWERVLAGESDIAGLAARISDPQDPSPDSLVARSSKQVYDGFLGLAPEVRRIIGDNVRDSTLGMARWVDRGPLFEDEGDLDDYMHEVAGRVGYLLTELFSLRSTRVRTQLDSMRTLGREFGLGLQTVNVIRGLSTDHLRGWIFVPRTYLGELASDPSQLFHPANQDVREAVLRSLVEKAERHLLGAEQYIRKLPRRERRVRVFCLLPYLFAVRTMALSRDNPAIFADEVKMPRSEVKTITRRSLAMGSSNGFISWYARRLATK